jgi:hypothetical protein
MSTPTPTTPIVAEDIKAWQGDDVVDPGGEKLGKLEEIYFDTETDEPGFAAVKSGTFGKHITLVPLHGATVGHDFVRVAASKEQFKNAPSFDTDAELSSDEEASAYGYFGIAYQPAGQGARRLAKH